MDNRKPILAVEFDEEDGKYIVNIPAGSSVPETAFAMTVVIKCLIRDGIVEKSADIINLINSYLDNPQYQEVNNGEG